MRPWTTRTWQAAVVAAGFAAAGAGTAGAATAPDLTEPDLSSVPDEIGFRAPVDACRAQEAPEFNSTKAPCVDADLHASAPNVVKQVGTDIVRTTHGAAGELRDGQPPNAKLAGVAQHVGLEKDRLLEMTKTRPNVGLDVQPEHTGLVEQHDPEGSFLRGEIGPRGKTHEGVSTADTAVSADVVHGYTVGPMARPEKALQPVVRNNPLVSDEPAVGLPKASEVLPGAKAATGMTHADELTSAPEQVVNGVAGGLPKAPEVVSGAQDVAEQTPIGDAASTAQRTVRGASGELPLAGELGSAAGHATDALPELPQR